MLGMIRFRLKLVPAMLPLKNMRAQVLAGKITGMTLVVEFGSDTN